MGRLRRTGVNQVSDGFGLRQIDLLVEKGPQRKLARLRQARAKLTAAGQQLAHDNRTTMTLKFEHVFAGE